MKTAANVFLGRWFLAGLVLGLAVLGRLGRRAVASDFHGDFPRFHLARSPEGNYYPTVGEMCADVRAHCRPEQVLVIVGGNSVLHGVWQPASEVWTRHLQVLLGGRYCVRNFSFRGAAPADGGAAIAEVLRDEFPRQIYVANERAVAGIDPLGSDAYRFMFWQAYFDGQLLDSAIRDQRVRERLLALGEIGRTVAIFGDAVFDRVLRYRELWNRVGHDCLFTVPAEVAPAPPAMFQPRRAFADDERDALAARWSRERYPRGQDGAELAIIRATTAAFYTRRPDGGWEMQPGTRAELQRYAAEAFPDALKPRTLLLLSGNSPHYRRLLTPDERARDEQGTSDSVALWRHAGYAALAYGADFNDDDFADRIHLTKLGGRKLAAITAVEIRALVERLGYL